MSRPSWEADSLMLLTSMLFSVKGDIAVVEASAKG